METILAASAELGRRITGGNTLKAVRTLSETISYALPKCKLLLFLADGLLNFLSV